MTKRSPLDLTQRSHLDLSRGDTMWVLAKLGATQTERMDLGEWEGAHPNRPPRTCAWLEEWLTHHRRLAEFAAIKRLAERLLTAEGA